MGAEGWWLGVLAFVLTYAIHSTVALGGAWLATRRLGDERARLRELIWKIGLVGGFVTAGLQLGLGWEPALGGWTLRAETVVADTPEEVRFGLLEARHDTVETRVGPALHGGRDHESAPSPALLATHGAGDGGAIGFESGSGSVPFGPRPSGAPGSFGGSGARAPAGVSGPPSIESAPLSPPGELVASTDFAWPSAGRIAGWIGAAWALLGLGILAAFGLHALRLRHNLAGRRELTEGPLFESLQSLLARSGRRRRVRLWIAPDLHAPISVGFVRPAICVPPRALDELLPEEQEAMLAHELAHVLRHDPSWLCFSWWVRSLFFFQPLNGIARRELVETAELNCDDWAVRHTGRQISLASCLARIAGWLVGEPRAVIAATMTGVCGPRGRSRLRLRIERLLEDEPAAEREPAHRWLAPSALGLLGALVLGVPGVAAVRIQEAAGGHPEHEAGRAGRELADGTDEAALPRAARRTRAAESEASGGRDQVLDTLEVDFGALDAEIVALEIEIGTLREVVAGVQLSPGLTRALDDMERRVAELTARRARMKSLVDRVLLLERSTGSGPAGAMVDRQPRPGETDR